MLATSELIERRAQLLDSMSKTDSDMFEYFALIELEEIDAILAKTVH